MKFVHIFIISVFFNSLKTIPFEEKLLTIPLEERLLTTTGIFFIFLDEKDNLKIYDHLGELNSTIHIPNELKKESCIKKLLTIQEITHAALFYQKGGDFKLVSIGGGSVFKNINDTLVKIDNSFNHRMTYQSAVFIENDTIFKFGGYGYWSNRNFMTFFDNKTKEWEYYNTNTILTPPPVASIKHSLIDNEFYFLQGDKSINAAKASRIPNLEIWKFSFIDRKWINFGISKLPLYESSVRIDDNKFLAKTRNGSYVTVNLKENKFNFVDTNQTTFNLNYFNSVVVKDTIYQLSKNNVIIKSPLNQIFFTSNSIDSSDRSIYLRSLELFNKLGLTTFSLVGLIIISLIFLKYRRNQRPRIDQLGLRYKGVNYKLTKSESQMIRCVLKQKEVPSQFFYDIVENSELSYPQNNKIKNDAIRKLNDKLEKILNIKDFIQSKKLEEDGRVLVYFSNQKEIFIDN